MGSCMIFKSLKQSDFVLGLPYEGAHWIIDYITVEPGSQCLMDSGNDMEPCICTASHNRLIDVGIEMTQQELYILDKGDSYACNPLAFS